MTSVTYALGTLFKDNVLERLLKTDMVAPMVHDLRTSDGPPHTTTTKLVPRKGPSGIWRHEMSDLLAASGLTRIAQDQRPPSIDEVLAALPGVPPDLVQAVHEAALRKWWQSATRLYHIVKGSVDLSGIFEKKDLEMIKSEYCFGDYRNGPAFLRWATGFSDSTTVSEQSKLISKVQDAKVPLSCTLDQFGQIISDLLIDWSAIHGNRVQHPAGFYYALLKAMPDVDQGKMALLRNWVAERMADNDGLLTNPAAFVERLVNRAETLGLAAGTGSINVTSGSTNNCKFCVSWLCTKGSSKSMCLCFNNRLPRPKGAKDNQWESFCMVA